MAKVDKVIATKVTAFDTRFLIILENGEELNCRLTGKYSPAETIIEELKYVWNYRKIPLDWSEAVLWEIND